MAPFYTSEGDTGETGYLGSGKISKASLRIEALGCVDEANAAIGLARALSADEKTRTILIEIQKQLYFLMTDLSASVEVAEKFDKLDQGHLLWLEEQIDGVEGAVDLPREFILPGGSPASGALDLARTIVRRAERRVVAMLEENLIQKRLLVGYLNRLSSLLFILEVYADVSGGHTLKITKDA